MKSWRKAKDFKCPYCPKDFDKERQLKQHIKDAHKEEPNEKVKGNTVNP